MNIVVFAAHPDDAEIGMAGTIARMTGEGKNVIVCDMTQGEMGTRGTAQSRKAEAEKSSEILGLKERINLELPDGGLQIGNEEIKKAVEIIRRYQPKVIFAPYYNDRHPDHIAAGEIVKRAYFFAGAAKYETFHNGSPQLNYRPTKLFFYSLAYEFEPSFIVDISEYIDKKIDAIQSFGSQFYNPENNEPETLISSKMFSDYLIARARSYGFRIRKDYGEAFFTEENIELDVESILKQGG